MSTPSMQMPVPRPVPIFISVKELAARWRRSPSAIHTIRHSGDGPPSMLLGGRVMFDLADVEAYETRQRQAYLAAHPVAAGGGDAA